MLQILTTIAFLSPLSLCNEYCNSDISGTKGVYAPNPTALLETCLSKKISTVIDYLKYGSKTFYTGVWISTVIAQLFGNW